MIKYFTIEDLLKHYLQKKFHILFFRFLHAEFTVITLYTQLPAMLILLVPETENQQAD